MDTTTNPVTRPRILNEERVGQDITPGCVIVVRDRLTPVDYEMVDLTIMVLTVSNDAPSTYPEIFYAEGYVVMVGDTPYLDHTCVSFAQDEPVQVVAEMPTDDWSAVYAIRASKGARVASAEAAAYLRAMKD